MHHLAVDCIWNDFSEWTDCSATCGTGTMTRIRTEAMQADNGGFSCTGDTSETVQCNTQACPPGK